MAEADIAARRESGFTPLLKIRPSEGGNRRDVFHLTRPRRATTDQGLPAILKPPPSVRLGTPSTGRSLRAVPRHPALRGAPSDLYGNCASQLSSFARLENERGAVFARAASALGGDEEEENEVKKVDTRFDGMPAKKGADKGFQLGLAELSSEAQRMLKSAENVQIGTPSAAPIMSPARTRNTEQKATSRRQSRPIKVSVNERSATNRVARRLGDLRSDPNLREELTERVQFIITSRRDRMKTAVSCVRRNRLRTALPMLNASGTRGASPPPSPTIPASRLPALLQPGDVVENISVEPPELGLFIHHAEQSGFGLFRWSYQGELTETEWSQVRVPDRAPRRELLHQTARDKRERALVSRSQLEEEYKERMRAFDPLHAEPEQSGRIRRWLVAMTLARSATQFSWKAGALRNVLQRVLSNCAARKLQRLWRKFNRKKMRDRDSSQPTLTRRMEDNLQTVWLRCVKLKRQEQTTTEAIDQVKWFISRFVRQNAMKWACLHILNTIRNVQRQYRAGRIIRTTRIAVLQQSFCRGLRQRIQAIGHALEEAGLGSLVTPLTPTKGRRKRAGASIIGGASPFSSPPTSPTGGISAAARSFATPKQERGSTFIPPTVPFQGQDVNTEELRAEREGLHALLPGNRNCGHMDAIILDVIRKKQTQYRMELREYCQKLALWRRLSRKFEIRLREAERENAQALGEALADVAQKAVRGATHRRIKEETDGSPSSSPSARPLGSPLGSPKSQAVGDADRSPLESGITKSSGILSSKAFSGLSAKRPAPAAAPGQSGVNKAKAAKRKLKIQTRGRAAGGQTLQKGSSNGAVNVSPADSQRRGTATLGEVLAQGLKATTDPSWEGATESLGPKPQPPRWHLHVPDNELLGWIGVALQASRDVC
eukprot:Hpha_TRINITY_DN18420_c0_g1::TRINITY_DN18420_c0_g1_i1::g.165491::m.165491